MTHLHHSESASWASWIRTSECSSQSAVSYRLTIAQEGWIKGFEPLASRATIWRANQLRHTHHHSETRSVDARNSFYQKTSFQCAQRDSNPRPTA